MVQALSVFETQPTDDGRLLVGSMASSTVAPGRCGCPAGRSNRLKRAAHPLKIGELRRHAVRKLIEGAGRSWATLKMPTGATLSAPTSESLIALLGWSRQGDRRRGVAWVGKVPDSDAGRVSRSCQR
ncbi:hypothetical protein GCM10010515_71030 [Streptomyces fructofermentans]|uniref:Uncharacterized protein n=1 Tax=Streptomyces fructofermentans TaxID=152141 RepID=A0A918NT47_9ACTN|nr:hypothetical protein GCM10010515_71030 [Streptomyces fructofermentans]